jgi:transposase InsO family protein
LAGGADRVSAAGQAVKAGTNFYTLKEAQIVIESWRLHYNSVRPHASLGYRPPAPEVEDLTVQKLVP